VRKLVAVVLGTCAVFVALFGAGLQSVAIFALGAAMLVLAISLVLVSAFGSGARAWVDGTGHVVKVSEPPASATYGRCELQLVIDAPGLPAAAVRVRDPRVPVAKWPDPGATVPIIVAIDDPRHVRIQWDDMLTHAEAAAVAAAQEYDEAEADRLADEFVAAAEGLTLADEPPTRDSGPAKRPASEQGPAKRPMSEQRPAEQPVSEPAEALAEEFFAGPPGGSDEPYGVSPTPTEAGAPHGAAGAPPREPGTVPRPRRPRPYPRRSPQPPAAPDSGASDPPGAMFGGAAGAAATGTALAEPPPGTEPPGTEPTRAEPPVAGPTTASRGARPGGSGAIHGVGITVLVADLDRSIAFYRDMLGFFEIDGGDDNVVLASGGTRLVLRAARDVAPVNRRLVHLNLEVGDLDAEYGALRAKGVRFTYGPRPVNRGERLELWAAAFRDPDGHGIALTQWRARPTP
jgi:catechol 2,3-dioxygenase-like lactoylglutathione lyase family enzyme